MSMPTVSDKTMDRLRKLVEKEELARTFGNIEDAEAFARLIQKLLTDHKLEMTDVELSLQDEKDPIRDHLFDPTKHFIKFKAKRSAWSESLAAAVAYGHFCRFMIQPRTNYVWFVGRESDTRVACFMYGVLYRFAETQSLKAYDRFYWECEKSGNRTAAKGYQSSWLNGFSSRIKDRYVEKVKKLKDDLTSAKDWGEKYQTESGEVDPSRALVIIDKSWDAVNEAFKKLTDKNPAEKLTVKKGNLLGKADGKAAADKVSLDSKGITPPTQPPSKVALNPGL